MSPGPASDLQTATAAAAQMVGLLGMGGSLISWEAAGGPPGANVVTKVLSTDVGREAVEAILERSKAEVTGMLKDNAHMVEALRDGLLERDELVGDEITAVISAAEARVLELGSLQIGV